VWVQNLVTGEVFNSSFLYEYTQHPYPVRNLEVTNENDNLQITWDAPEENNPTGYNIYVNNELVANNTKELSYSTTNSSDYYVVEAVALYDNRKSVGVIKSSFPKNEDENGSDTTNLVANYENRFEIYPNPANDILFINAEVEINEVMIYDVYGRLQVTKSPSHQELTSVNVSGLNAGIYIIKIKTNEGNIVKRFIKQ
ncbi:MAG: T9SS type A sorting domain-containing protein, partial [Bacteroidales bacterium]|nr:T9SS type A sorting domain-containing protein [Bacteroidales bacterium]